MKCGHHISLYGGSHSPTSLGDVAEVRKLHVAHRGPREKKGKAAAPAQPQHFTSVEVTGLAATDVQVADFVANLLGNRLLASVDMNYTQDKVLNANKKDLPQYRVREFKVTMELRPNVDVIDLIRTENAAAGDPEIQGAES